MRHIYEPHQHMSSPELQPVVQLSIPTTVDGMNNSMAIVLLCRQIILNKKLHGIDMSEIREMKLIYTKYIMSSPQRVGAMYKEVVNAELDINAPTLHTIAKLSGRPQQQSNTMLNWLLPHDGN
jgi:hypothetical protein